MNTLFYFDLEAVVNRYTEQLSQKWMPWSLLTNCPSEWNISRVIGSETKSQEINKGQVLDACGRSIYAMEQCISFQKKISAGEVKDGDVLYFQDFWTPGIESIFYTLEMYGIKTRNYAMLHAQSVDEYDFTYSMRNWMRPFELGIDKKMDGIFVGSQIHKDQLRATGFEAPIYVVSLPFGKRIEENKKNRKPMMESKKNQVMFTSRFDFEKNPLFMLEVADKFLTLNPTWEWIITTGASEIRSNDQFIIDKINAINKKHERFRIITNISKEKYYDCLAESKIHFNSSLQDYVSWTLIEATTFGCDVVYPKFRSFEEILPDNRMYKAFSVDSALSLLKDRIRNYDPSELKFIPELSELGLLMETYIMFNDWKEHEVNIWLEKEYCKEKFGYLLNL